MALPNLTTGFITGHKGESPSRMGTAVMCNVITEVISCNLCYILLVRSKSVGPAHTQRVGITQGCCYQAVGLLEATLEPVCHTHQENQSSLKGNLVLLFNSLSLAVITVPGPKWVFIKVCCRKKERMERRKGGRKGRREGGREEERSCFPLQHALIAKQICLHLSQGNDSGLLYMLFLLPGILSLLLTYSLANHPGFGQLICEISIKMLPFPRSHS